MKQQLKELYGKNRRDFDVWNFLWLFSSKKDNSIEFSHSELCSRFSVPPSSLHRILKIYPEQWNEGETIMVEYNKVGYGKYRVRFFAKGKKKDKQEIHTIYDELYEWLGEYYRSIDFDYSDMDKHKRYVKLICDKLEKAMKERETEINDESIKETFRVFFQNIDEWWIEQGNITLTLVNKHFTKILNQIKSNRNGKKGDSYSRTREEAESIDFSKLTRN
jgi:hypothetical protein